MGKRFILRQSRNLSTDGFMVTKSYCNPFVPMLVIVGIIFVVTASAYGLMAYQVMPTNTGVQIHNLDQPQWAHSQWSSHPLWLWMRNHANKAILTELVALGILTAAAIGTDHLWKGSPVERQVERQKVKDAPGEMDSI